MIENVLDSGDYKKIILAVKGLGVKDLAVFLENTYNKYSKDNKAFFDHLRKEVTYQEVKAYSTGLGEVVEDMEEIIHLTSIQKWLDKRIRFGFIQIEIEYPFDSETEGVDKLYNVLKKLELNLPNEKEYYREKNPRFDYNLDMLRRYIQLLESKPFEENKDLFFAEAEKLHTSFSFFDYSQENAYLITSIYAVPTSIKYVLKHKVIQEKIKNNHFPGLATKSGDIAVYQLPSTFSFKNKNVKGHTLDTEQNAILFSLLREHGVIGDFSNPSLGTLVHYLTGWDETNLKKDLSTNYREILEFKEGKPSVENLETVKKLFTLFITQIDTEVERVKLKHKNRGK